MIKYLFTAMLMLSTLSEAFTQEAVRKEQFNIKSGIAIQGYDPVAYFKENKAVKGKQELAVFYQGITYNFSSAENKDAFKKEPAKYEPAYGGWCAYAMGATGEKVNIDPATYKIVDGKLYLFYNRFFNNTLKDWNKDETHLKPKADVSWRKFYH